MPHKTISMNGRLYDAVTGLPIEGAASPAKAENQGNHKASHKNPPKTKPSQKLVATQVAARAVHAAGPQRTQTLRGRAAKKPAAPQKVITKRNSPGRHMDIARSSTVTKFAPHPVKKPLTPTVDKAPQVHPMAKRALSRIEKQRPATQKTITARQVKDEAIAAALTKPQAKPIKKVTTAQKWRRRILITGAITLVIAGGLFIVYRFIPSVSVGVAAAQAGVNASYPEFIPDGFGLSHPVTYTDGEVVLKFKSNSNESFYTITQTRSSWDSSAVLDTVVRAAAGENYVTTKERGLTIYTYGESAAWVNKGVLYKIKSSSAAILSGEQIRRIATSL